MHYRRIINEASDAKKLENRDRVALQIQSAERHRDRHLETHRRILKDLKEKGSQLVPARLGLISKAEKRFDVQKESLRAKSELTSHRLDICAGAVCIE